MRAATLASVTLGVLLATVAGIAAAQEGEEDPFLASLEEEDDPFADEADADPFAAYDEQASSAEANASADTQAELADASGSTGSTDDADSSDANDGPLPARYQSAQDNGNGSELTRGVAAPGAVLVVLALAGAVVVVTGLKPRRPRP